MTSPEDEQADRAARNHHVVRAVAWTGAGRYAGQVFRWGTTLVVARVLSPNDYGLVGMTGLFAGFVAILAEFGVGAAVLRMRALDEDQLSQLNGLSLLLGSAAMLFAIAAAWPLSVFFRRTELMGIVAVSSVGFVFSALQTIPIALLQRDMRFKSIAAVEVVGALLLALLTLVMALSGAGYWSLVFPPLVVGWVNALRFRRAARVRLAMPKMERLRAAFNFSSWFFGGRLAGYLYATADFLTVGRVLGSSALGGYTLAWDLANAPNDQINGLVARVSSSFYSSVQNDRSELARLVLRFIEAVSCVSMPLVIGLALVAPEFVTTVLGSKWTSAIVPLQLLCVFASMRIVVIIVTPLLAMIGDVKFQPKVAAAALLYLPVLFVIAARLDGTRGVAAAWLIGYPPMAWAMAWRTKQQLQLGRWRLLQALFPAVVGCLVMSLFVVATRWALAPSIPSLLHLIALVLAGGVGYIGVFLLFFRPRLSMLKGVLSGAFAGKQPRAL